MSADESKINESLVKSLDRLGKILERLEERVEKLEKPDRKGPVSDKESPGSAGKEPRREFPHFPFDRLERNIERRIEDEVGRHFGGESRAKTEEYKLKDFTGVEIGGIFEIEIVRGDSYGVSITAEENLFRNLDVSSEDGTLRIGHSRHIGWKAQITRPKARITLPVLKELRLHGASRANISGFDSAEPFKLSLSGASRASGDIKAGDAEFDLSGASHAILTGSARDVAINASGAINLELGEFSVHNVSVKMSGVCNGVIKMDGRLDARLSGVSHFNWVGNPEMGSIRTSGHSSLGKA